MKEVSQIAAISLITMLVLAAVFALSPCDFVYTVATTVSVSVVLILITCSCVYWLNAAFDENEVVRLLSIFPIPLAVILKSAFSLSCLIQPLLFGCSPPEIAPSIAAVYPFAFIIASFTGSHWVLSYGQERMADSYDERIVIFSQALAAGAFTLGALVFIAAVFKAIHGNVEPPLSTLPAIRVFLFWVMQSWGLIAGVVDLWLAGRIREDKKTNGLEKYVISAIHILILMGIFYLKTSYENYYPHSYRLVSIIMLLSFASLITITLSIFLNNRNNRRQIVSIVVALFSVSLVLIIAGWFGESWTVFSPILDVFQISSNIVPTIIFSSLISIGVVLVYDRISTKGEFVMEKIEVKLGNRATFYGDFVVAKLIQDSFNKAASAHVSNELKEMLQDLSAAVGKMIEALPEEERRRLARALETLIDEATSEGPERQWWEVSVEGLKKAAENIGEIGKPVLDIVARLVPILTLKSG